MDEAVRRQLSGRLAFHAEKLKLEQAAWADYQYRKAHPWRARMRALAADLADGLDAGLTEILRVLGIDRASRAQRRVATALLEQR